MKVDREKIFQKFGGKCAYCGCELQKGWHVDHVEAINRVPRRVGEGFYNRNTNAPATPEEIEQWTSDGSGVQLEYRKAKTIWEIPKGHELHSEENMMPSCPSCNINKHGMTIEEFRDAIYQYMKSLNERFVQYKMIKKYGLIKETGSEVKFYFEKEQQP